jgi:uncharacterized protein YqeY
MTTLKGRLRADLHSAIKARDEVRAGTLRLVLTAITTEEVAGKQARTLSEDEIFRVLTREVKKRREAATAFAEAGRTEKAELEQAEGAIIEAYLPAQLPDDELTSLVAAAIAETGADSPRAMGQVMKAVNPRVAGRAEGGRVAAEVRRQLDGR